MKLTTGQVTEILEKDLTGWDLSSDPVELKLQKEYSLNNFKEAIEFVNQIAESAESMSHHPDILIKYNKVLVTTWTHDVSGLTKKDINLAHQIDTVYEER